MTRRAPPVLPVLAAFSLMLAPLSGGASEMAFPGGEWEEVPPESEGFDREGLERALAFLEEHAASDGVAEVAIARNGRLVWKGPRAASRHGVWSVTKSFTSTVLGLLVQDGKCALETPAARFAPELGTVYPGAELRHFATMTSGYRARGDEPAGSYRHGPSRTPFLPSDAPLFAPPGTRFAYWDSAMNELGYVLTRIAGEPMDELFQRRVADAIGLVRGAWAWGDFGEMDGVRVSGGAGNHGKHVQVSALGLLRLGHLFLNRGRWADRQVLEPRWVDLATSVHVPASMPLEGEPAIDGRGVYGLNWWVNGIRPDGRRKWPGAPAGTFAASGYNNNDLFVVPEWGLVVARLGLDEAERKIADETHGEFLRLLGEALGADADRSSRAWRLASPRDEIAPAAWRDGSVLFRGEPTFALAGRGLDAADGSWVRSEAVAAGGWVRMEAFYRAERVEEPERSVLARLTWRREDGRHAAPAEFPRTQRGESEGGWRRIAGTYRVPEEAVRAEIELVYRWDGDGEVRFGGARFEASTEPHPRIVNLAAVHHRPRRSAGPRENVEAFARFVAQAAEKGADVVCLPEGITVVGTGKTYAEVSEAVPGPTTRRLGDAARKHAVYVVAGIYERDGAAVYNTAVLLDPSGELAGKYRKVSLPREEIEGGITPGEALPVFDTEFGRVGLMVCWDVFFPEPARELGKKGAEVIFLPIWGGDLTLARARAIENQVYLVTSTYDMKTAVFDRRGEVLAEASEANPVIVVEVDLNERTLWPWLGDFQSRIPREAPSEKALGGGSR